MTAFKKQLSAKFTLPRKNPELVYALRDPSFVILGFLENLLCLLSATLIFLPPNFH
jgi:hypothetical protein